MTTEQSQSKALIYSAFVAGLCSIVYELLIATTVSYFLGDSVTYFSITIGLYMAAMGAGSYCSKFINSHLVKHFILLEVALAAIGGLSVPLLYLSYAAGGVFMPTYISLTLVVGFLIGMEIPFLTRLMEDFQTLKSNIANILSFDYVGALIATLAFPFFLLPSFGNYQSSLILGLVNLSIVVVVSKYFRNKLDREYSKIVIVSVIVFLLLVVSIILTKPALERWDRALFSARVVHAEQTRYQKIVITHEADDTRMYLNGSIQFSSRDEHRYHEALVIYPMSFAAHPIKKVLLLGAGDGLAIKQLLKYDAIEKIVLVDLDKRVVELATENPYLAKLNQGSLQNDKVDLVQGDALGFIEDSTETFDLIICDLPDPNSLALARLYTRYFYHQLSKRLAGSGVFVTQATSPYFAKKAFWSIVNTVRSAGFQAVAPYHADVPSFGNWGFVMATKNPFAFKTTPALSVPTRYLTSDLFEPMRIFAKDAQFKNAQINRIDSPILLDYYLEGWRSHGY